MNVDKLWELRLFQILRVRGNAFYIVDSKHSYTDIVIYINGLIEKGFIQKRDDQYILTASGQTRYIMLCKALGKRGLYKYFMEADEYRITKFGINEVYIPRKSLK